MITKTEALIALVQGKKVKTKYGIVFTEFSEHGVPNFFFLSEGKPYHYKERLDQALNHAVGILETKTVRIQGKTLELTPYEAKHLKEQLEAL